MTTPAVPTPFALDHNYAEANRILVAFTKRGEYRERSGVAIVSSGFRSRR